ncbi:hypothetical protein RND81_09G264400 [Saponaria officinalis]|uniref:Uncharacterized protein n=1 Tax=Saponaria officinalis TaxID=3572 RepID=A0AAW1ISA6_SAPOF
MYYSIRLNRFVTFHCGPIFKESKNKFTFLNLFNYYLTSDDQDLFSKELQLDSKVFCFDVGENRRGCFLKVSEASMSRNCSTIIIPAGITGDEGWAAFRNILAEINEALGLFSMSNQVAGPDCSSIILPLSGLRQFYEILWHFVEISKDRIEGTTSANVRTVDHPKR